MMLYKGEFYFIPRDPLPSGYSSAYMLFIGGVNTCGADGEIVSDKIPSLQNTQEFSMREFWMIRIAGERENFEPIKVEAKDEIGQIAAEFN
ncbi:MAG: hypothetical protein LUC34_04055 [Campylobacter sp.]|nr:hypothetical protein [Campylobacter sp.]